MSQRAMSEARTYDNPIIDTILHPSDFSEASEAAFAHALKTALVAHSRLTLLHVTSDRTPGWWTDFPGVRRTLERWGLLPPNSPQSAVPELGIDVEKILRHGRDPRDNREHHRKSQVHEIGNYQGVVPSCARWSASRTACCVACHGVRPDAVPVALAADAPRITFR